VERDLSLGEAAVAGEFDQVGLRSEAGGGMVEADEVQALVGNGGEGGDEAFGQIGCLNQVVLLRAARVTGIGLRRVGLCGGRAWCEGVRVPVDRLQMGSGVAGVFGSGGGQGEQCLLGLG